MGKTTKDGKKCVQKARVFVPSGDEDEDGEKKPTVIMLYDCPEGK